ncbi:hypothetical protein [Bacillus thuringiensis]|uniref:hypothetical protein n=1 Tax=Bacillus thuringiensis TaxID=1428 RepID=UPI002175858D|nr:hypothetical protein [Bacillus thuringiensis]
MFAKYYSQDDEFMSPLQFIALGGIMSFLIKFGCISPSVNMLTLFVTFVTCIGLCYFFLLLITMYFYRFLAKHRDNLHVYLCNKYNEKIANRIGLCIGLVYIVGVLVICLLI